MSKKDKMLNLFEFLMELMDEPTKKSKKEKNKKRNKLSTLKKHNKVPNLKKQQKHIKKLMNKVDVITKVNSTTDYFKSMVLDKTTNPLTAKINDLKIDGISAAMKDKAKSEREYVETLTIEDNKSKNSPIEKHVGVTLKDGKASIISIDRELRDKIPLDGETITATKYQVGKKIGTVEIPKKHTNNTPKNTFGENID